MTIEEALKSIHEKYYMYKNISISFDDDGKSCAIYTDGIYNGTFLIK